MPKLGTGAEWLLNLPPSGAPGGLRHGDPVIFDDPVRPVHSVGSSEPPETDAADAVAAALQRDLIQTYADALFGEFPRGGAYRNRASHLVTWDSSADGSYVVVQTRPGE
jgi:hypothetical protein